MEEYGDEKSTLTVKTLSDDQGPLSTFYISRPTLVGVT